MHLANNYPPQPHFLPLDPNVFQDYPAIPPLHPMPARTLAPEGLQTNKQQLLFMYTMAVVHAYNGCHSRTRRLSFVHRRLSFVHTSNDGCRLCIRRLSSVHSTAVIRVTRLGIRTNSYCSFGQGPGWYDVAYICMNKRSFVHTTSLGVEVNGQRLSFTRGGAGRRKRNLARQDSNVHSIVEI